MFNLFWWKREEKKKDPFLVQWHLFWVTHWLMRNLLFVFRHNVKNSRVFLSLIVSGHLFNAYHKMVEKNECDNEDVSEESGCAWQIAFLIMRGSANKCFLHKIVVESLPDLFWKKKWSFIYMYAPYTYKYMYMYT